MKKLFLTVFILTSIANALHIQAFSPNLKKLDAFINELKPFMDHPMNWCEINETGEYKDYSRLYMIEVKVVCNYQHINKSLNHIYVNYGDILRNKQYSQYIDSAFDVNFPMYDMFWGAHQMAYDAFALRIIPKSEYMDENSGNNNGYIYFKVVVDGIEQDEVRYYNMNGSTISFMSNFKHENTSDYANINVKVNYERGKSHDITFKRIWSVEPTDELIPYNQNY